MQRYLKKSPLTYWVIVGRDWLFNASIEGVVRGSLISHAPDKLTAIGIGVEFSLVTQTVDTRSYKTKVAVQKLHRFLFTKALSNHLCK